MPKNPGLFFKVALGICLLILTPSRSEAQLPYNYTPRERHSALSVELLNSVSSSFDEEDRVTNGNKEVQKINHSRKIYFLKKIREGAFVKDDSIETYVNNVLNKIVSDNSLDPYPRRVLVMASPHVNAVCFGRGIFAVTISLLGRIENENQLAFILAHEVAHDELAHITSRIAQEADMDLAEKTEDQITNILSDKISMQDVEEFRKLVYGISKYSRKSEMRADSMAVALMSGAHYNEGEALAALTILQSAQSPKKQIGAEIFLPFHSPDYPFQDHWLNDRLSVFGKKYSGSFLYSIDSVETHPAIELRKDALLSFCSYDGEGINYQTENFARVTEMAAFETVETAFQDKEYDVCMYYAMQLYTRYPDNVYLVSRMGKIFLDLMEARASNRFQELVSKYTVNYCDELKLINSFLYNLTYVELGEVAFHFLNSNTTFNDEQESHYYLLWKVSDYTYRVETKNKLKVAFKEKFGSAIASYRYQ
jgi:predicted Zn-dependent protease